MGSKAINRGASMAAEMGGGIDIAMPPLEAMPSVAAQAPNPWDNQLAPEQQSDIAPVPDYVPEYEEEQSQPEEQYEEPVAQAKPNPREENFTRMRIAREKAERERDELMKLLLAQQNQQRPEPQYVEEDYDDEIDPDALVEGKNLKKVTKQMRDMQSQLRQYQQQSNQQIMEARIRAQYPDFERVVSEENVAILKNLHPEVAESLRNTTDLYSQAAAAYKVIKNFGIHKEEYMSNDKARALKNSVKPKPLASVNPQQGDSPLAKANAFATGEFTAEMKDRLRKEMEAARKRY